MTIWKLWRTKPCCLTELGSVQFGSTFLTTICDNEELKQTFNLKILLYKEVEINSLPLLCKTAYKRSNYLYKARDFKYPLWHPVYVSNRLTNHWLKLDKWPLGLKLDVSLPFRATVRYDWPLLCWQKINLKFGVWQCFCQGCNWDPRYPLCHLTKN